MLNNKTIARELIITKLGENELIKNNEELLNILSKYYDKDILRLKKEKIIDEIKKLLLRNKDNFERKDQYKIVLYYIDNILTEEENKNISKRYLPVTGLGLYELEDEFEDNFKHINTLSIDEIIEFDDKLLESETYRNSKYHKLITEIKENLFLHCDNKLKIFLFKLYNTECKDKYNYYIINELYKKMHKDYNILSNKEKLDEKENKKLKNIRMYHKLFENQLDNTNFSIKDYSKFLIEFNLINYLSNKTEFTNFKDFEEKIALVRNEYEKENETYYTNFDNFISNFNKKYPNLNFNILKNNNFVKLDKKILYLILEVRSKKYFTELQVRNSENNNNYSFQEEYNNFQKHNEYKKEIELKYKDKLDEVKKIGKYNEITMNYYRNLILDLDRSEESTELRRYITWYNNTHKDYFNNHQKISELDYYNKLIENLKNNEIVTPITLGPIKLKYERYFSDVLGRDNKNIPTPKKRELKEKMHEIIREKSKEYVINTRLYILNHYKETLLSGENFFENVDENIDIRIIKVLLSDCLVKDSGKILEKIQADNEEYKIKKRLEQKLPEHLEIVKKLISTYNCSKKDYLEHENTNTHTLTVAISNVKERAPEIYEQLEEARKQVKEDKILKTVEDLDELYNYIQNGYIEEDNEVHNFELLDYYKHTNLEPERFMKFLHKGQNKISSEQDQKMIKFFGTSKKIYLNRQDELEDKHIMIVNGEEYEVTIDEKKQAFDYLDKYNMPNYPKLYKQALKRILNKKIENKQLKK